MHYFQSCDSETVLAGYESAWVKKEEVYMARENSSLTKSENVAHGYESKSSVSLNEILTIK